MLNKRLLESASVLVLAGILTVVGVMNGNGTTTAVDADSNQSQVEAGIYAGATDYLESLDLDNVVAVNVTVEKEEVELATSTDVEASEEQLSEEELEWQNKLIANIGESTLNVRESASTDAEIVGKMESGDVAEVVEKGDKWTLIQSGNVEGYVSNDYCIYASEAYAYALENFKTVATSKVDGLRVRSSADTDADVVKKLSEGASLTVDTDAKDISGWVAVIYDDETCYVSADYVTVAMDYGTALTIEEIKEIEEAKAAAEAAEAAENNSKSGNYQTANTVQGEGISYTEDELYLLASLLYCEAGGQGYDCQLACGAVIVSRVKDSRFPNSIYDVIYQAGQYGPTRSGSLDRAMANGSATQSCFDAARAALSGVDNTNGALGFQGVSCGYDGVEYNGMLFYNIWD